MRDRSRVQVELGKRQMQYVDMLLETGLYGPRRADVVRTLMQRGLEEAVKSGLIRLR